MRLPKLGDVYRLAPRVFIRVVAGCDHRDRHGEPIYYNHRQEWSTIWDFYYVVCKRDGTLPAERVEQYGAANCINHSNCLFSKEREAMEYVHNVPLKEYTVWHNCKKYSWTETGIEELDQYISQVDARYRLWVDVLRPERGYCRVELYQFAWNFEYLKRQRMRLKKYDLYSLEELNKYWPMPEPENDVQVNINLTRSPA